MAALRDHPYVQFTFLVNLGDGMTEGPQAGFQEMSNLGTEVGQDRRDEDGSVQKITGLNKATDVTMKRGVVASSSLDLWLDQIRDGDRRAHRTVTIWLQNEDRHVVRTWKLRRARIIKHTSGPFNAKGPDVPMEQLTLSYDRLEEK